MIATVALDRILDAVDHLQVRLNGIQSRLDAEFNESDHPRATDGKFGSGGGSKKAKLTPTEKSYVSSYTGDDFYRVNRELRDGDASDPSVKHLDNAIGKETLPAGIKLYRGMDRAAAKKFIGGDGSINAGDVLSDPAFMSTSATDGGALGYGSMGGVVFEITTGEGQKGLDVAALTRNPQEKEVLLPRKTKMKVSSIRPPKSVGEPIIIRVTTVAED